jgi:hypothetical protein
VDDALSLLHQLLDEAPQTELLGIGRGHDAVFQWLARAEDAWRPSFV